ncbi:MAG: hypothetical protein V1835_05100 [Candidatus Micrarchaeota archaeon]
MAIGTVRFSREDVRSAPIGKNEKRLMEHLFEKPLDVSEAEGFGGRRGIGKTSRNIVNFFGPCLVYLSRRGRITKKQNYFTHLALDPERFEINYPINLKAADPERVLYPQERLIWRRLVGGPATFQEICGLFSGKNNVDPRAISAMISRINNGLAQAVSDRPISSVRGGGGYRVYSIDPRIRSQYRLGTPSIDINNILHPRYKKMVEMLLGQRRWLMPDFATNAGLGSTNLSKYLASFENQVVGLGYPRPLVKGGPKGAKFIELSPEFQGALGVYPPFALQSFFTRKDSGIIRYISDKPGATPEEISKHTGIELRNVDRRLKVITRTAQRNGLPPIYRFKVYGTCVSTVFAKKFGLPAPRNDLVPFLKGIRSSIFNELEGSGTAKLTAIAKKLGVSKKVVSNHVKGIGLLLGSTHIPLKDYIQESGDVGPEMEYLSKIAPTINFRGEIWVPKSALAYDYHSERAAIEKIISGYLGKVAQRTGFPSTAKASIALLEFPKFLLMKRLGQTEESLSGLDGEKPNGFFSTKRNYLLLVKDLLENALQLKSG